MNLALLKGSLVVCLADYLYNFIDNILSRRLLICRYPVFSFGNKRTMFLQAVNDQDHTNPPGVPLEPTCCFKFRWGKIFYCRGPSSCGNDFSLTKFALIGP